MHITANLQNKLSSQQQVTCIQVHAYTLYCIYAWTYITYIATYYITI